MSPWTTYLHRESLRVFMVPKNVFAKEFRDRHEGLMDVQQERNYMSCLRGSRKKSVRSDTGKLDCPFKRASV